MKTFTRKI